MKKLTFFAMALMAVALCVTVSAQEPLPAVWVDMTEVGGLTPDGYMPCNGVNLTIPVRFLNVDEPRTAISNGFYFHSSDASISNISFAWNPAYPLVDILAFMLGCYPPPLGDCYAWFDHGHWETPIDKGLGGVGIAALASSFSEGMPADFDDVAYTITLDQVTGSAGSVLTMDTTWWEPANFWLWSGVGENVSWGGPYDFQFAWYQEPYTKCWPQPVELGVNDNDRVLNVSIFSEQNDLVDLTSVSVFGKIPSYTNDGVAWIEGDSIVTDCFLMRFLGSGGFRPLDPNGIISTYFVTYQKGGVEKLLVGDFLMNVNDGDVTFDGSVGLDDIIFMTERLFGGGPGCELDGYPMDECMDVDHSGRFDLLDVRALIEIVY